VTTRNAWKELVGEILDETAYIEEEISISLRMRKYQFAVRTSLEKSFVICKFQQPRKRFFPNTNVDSFQEIRPSVPQEKADK